jgi:manganese-transporting P-type ATPase
MNCVQGKSIVKSYALSRRGPLGNGRRVWALLFGLCAWGSLAFYRDAPGSFFDEIGWLSLGIAFLLQVVWTLCVYWFVRFQSWVYYSKATDIANADAVFVKPKASKGAATICRVHWRIAVDVDSNSNSNSRKRICYFVWQQRCYTYCDDVRLFVKPRYPVGKLFGEYKSARGVRAGDVDALGDAFGRNRMDIPLPTFGKLYKEHALAPLFVFQVFCVGLWCLDEYWMYSVFTLFMLLLLEAVVVRQRLANVAKLRAMVRKPFNVHAFRGDAWQSIASDALLPGDIVALRPDAENLVPCDALLLTGTCIVNEAMLTGESKPQRKDAVLYLPDDEQLDVRMHRDAHILSAGTKIVQATPRSGGGASSSSSSDDGNEHINAKGYAWQRGVPSGCCAASVLRTGFGTDQGRLLRTILFSTGRVSANSAESGFFILFLLSFAVAAVVYVVQRGIEQQRGTYKLVLDCALIITSVVPPELPIELSLAVNTSLAALVRLGVFCTEPFRVPFAGKIDVACFDKTGTLTSEEIVMRGVGGLPEDTDDASSSFPLHAPSEISERAQHVIAGCQSLVHGSGAGLIGDPMEARAMRAIGWMQSAAGLIARGQKSERLRIVHRFPFNSAAKRMTTVVQMEHARALMVTCKGAPEVVRSLLGTVPPSYDAAHRHFALEGGRVLALACRRIDAAKEARTVDAVRALPRAAIESNLEFVGFVVFACPLKAPSKGVIDALQRSSHRCVMITGDAVLTACYVARATDMCRHERVLIVDDAGAALVDAAEPSVRYAPLAEHYRRLADSHDIAMSGIAFQALAERAPTLLAELVPHVVVFARVTPQQKEAIVHTLNERGFTTLMCGDGTNDVGALKQAHVGLSLVTADADKKSGKKRAALASSSSSSSSSGAATAASSSTTTMAVVAQPMSAIEANRAKLRARQQRAQAQTQQKAQLKALQKKAARRRGAGATAARQQLSAAMAKAAAEQESTMVQLGDASIAAPFSTKSSSIEPVLHVLRQGRCTLVTTYQTFVILALNSLISAYSLSVLSLEGVKYGDTQMTVSGMLITFCFLFVSRAKPLTTLSAQRPPRRLFCVSIFAPILTQFAIHLVSLMRVVELAKSMTPADELAAAAADRDGDFAANLVNSGVFIISLCMQVATFAANYQGRPFMQSLVENRPLLASLTATTALLFALASELMPDLNASLELVPFPAAFRYELMLIVALDFGASIGSELLFRWISRRFWPST